MKLSNDTVTVLKNFSTINQNLAIKSGSTISTMSAMKNIVAKANVKETFPSDFAIYDLNEFLAVLSLHENPELDIHTDHVIIKKDDGSDSSQYFFSDPSVVTTPQKEITMPSVEVSFKLTSNTLAQVQKAAAVVGAPDMVLENGELKVTDKKNPTANNYRVPVDGLEVNNITDYKFWFKVENLKILSGSYSVDVSEKRISHFKHDKVDIEYFIAMENG